MSAARAIATSCREPSDELTVLGRERAAVGGTPSTQPGGWPRRARSSVATSAQAEWTRYLPGRDRAPTCTDLP